MRVATGDHNSASVYVNYQQEFENETTHIHKDDRRLGTKCCHALARVDSPTTAICILSDREDIRQNALSTPA